MIRLYLWQLILIIAVAVLLVVFRPVRKFQLFWLRNTNSARALQALEDNARADLRCGTISPSVFRGISRLIQNERLLSVDGWQRRDNRPYEKDLDVLLIGMNVSIDDTVGKKYGFATAEAVRGWLAKQAV